MANGELKKLKIIAYSDIEFKKEISNGTFNTLVNPEKYTLSYAIEYDDKQADGTSAHALPFKKIKPSDLEIQILFDGTGVFNKGNDVNVTDEIAKFKEMMFTLDGDSHRPNFVKISWGSLLFKGCLLDINFEYKLFDSDGEPLRVIAKAKYKSAVEDNLRAAEENKSSPDLTHIRVVKAGDNLPLMTHRIYGDSKYYLEVAKYNKLSNFRKLIPGTEIIFPPIEKQA